MDKFATLMVEVVALKSYAGLDTLEALEYILDHQDEYSSAVLRQLRLFMCEGEQMFAAV
jgi:hypothetical protein